MTLRDYETVMKAVSDPTRVRILKILEGGELCVCQIIAVLSLAQSTISKHLFLLKTAGLIQDRRDRKWIHYFLDRDGNNLYAAVMLRNLRKWLRDDPVILRDHKRVEQAREMGPVAICERRMTLPGRRPLPGARRSARVNPRPGSARSRPGAAPSRRP